jgi:hypothetical protein
VNLPPISPEAVLNATALIVSVDRMQRDGTEGEWQVYATELHDRLLFDAAMGIAWMTSSFLGSLPAQTTEDSIAGRNWLTLLNGFLMTGDRSALWQVFDEMSLQEQIEAIAVGASLVLDVLTSQ